MKGMSVFILFFASWMVYAGAAISGQLSPVGYWQTIDDSTGRPRGVVQLSMSPDQTLVGKIVKIYPRPGHDASEVCHACVGEKHNQPILGMIFLERLKQDGKNNRKWAHGEILDPQNGKTYHCNLLVQEGGEKLHVRGYIGLPVFGRSQVWHKIESLKDA